MTDSRPGTPHFDVYISSATADREIASVVADGLRDRGLKIRFEEPDSDSVGIRRAIDDGLARSKVLVAVYSRAYSRRRTCQSELVAAHLAAVRDADRRGRILILTAEPSPDEFLPDALTAAFLGATPLPDDSEGWSDLLDTIESRASRIPSAFGAARALSAPPWHGVSRVGSSRFVGRFADMWRIHSTLHPPSGAATELGGVPRVTLHGGSGCGKSLLAEEYAMRFDIVYPGGVFWLRAFGTSDTGDAMVRWQGLGAEEREAERDRQIRNFAADLGVIVSNRTPTEIREVLAETLERRQQACLWVVDDAPPEWTAADLAQWTGPQSITHTIVTTRSEPTDWGAAFEVGPLEPDEAYDLITTNRKPVAIFEEEEAARGIINNLGGHALALDVASCHLRGPDAFQSFSALRSSLEPTAHEVAGATKLTGFVSPGHEAAVIGVVNRTIGRLDHEGREFLRLAAVLSAAPISPALYAATLGKVEELDSESAEYFAQVGVQQADLRSLTQHAEADDGDRSVHAVVLQVVRALDPHPVRMAILRAAAVLAIMDKLPRTYDPSAYSAVEHEITHARELVRDATTVTSAELMGRVARYDLVRGAHTSGAGLYERQRDALSTLYGERHPETITSMANLAGARFVTGDLPEALGLHEEVVRIRREELGDDHSDTLAAMSNLAATLSIVGDLAGARSLQASMLAIRNRLHGPEHPKTTGAAWNLMLTLQELGDLQSASVVYTEYMQWMMDRSPVGLATEQRRIRDALAAMPESSGSVTDAPIP